MTLFKNNPPIEKWFADLFTDLLDSFPGTTGGLKLMPKYWHSLRTFRPENLERAFIRATEICKFFPKVPELLEIQASGFGSQPYAKPRSGAYDDGRGSYPPVGSEAHDISRHVMVSILKAMRDGIERPKERDQIWADCRAYQDEMRLKYQAAMGNFNPDTGEEFTDEVPF